MDTRIETDVIIVGAGPTGLSLACQLTRHGIDFVAIEKNPTVTPFSKAVGVHARTLEIYEQMDLAGKAISQGTIAGKVRLLEGGEVRGEMDLSQIGEGLSAYPYMLILEQNKNERLLYDYLQTNGQDVLWQTELVSFSQSGEGVSAQVKRADGTTLTIDGKYLVGCDGPRSLVRHTLGLSFEGSTFERIFYVADVEIDWEHGHDALNACLTKNSVVAFFPLRGEKRYRIVGAFPEGLEKDESEILYEEIERRVREETVIPLDITKVEWFSTYKVHSRRVEKFSEGRCFLAGDSAHIHTPAGGQGMNTGIQDAYNLAWKLAAVLKGNANPRILDTYSPERVENAKRLLETTDRMFNVVAGTDWLLNIIRTTIFPPLAKYILGMDAVKKRFFPLISQIGISYPDSPLSQHMDAEEFEVKAGARMPYFLVDGRSIFDELRAPKFHLLTFSDGEGDYGGLRKTVEAEFGSMMDYHVVALYPHVTEIFGASKPFNVLLRPDNHIGFITTDTSPDSVWNYMRDVLGRV
jgi:2-polyprenyl-6-methoxyphenol hydroxylase-like FAD-dependent oxidoreductase